MVNIKALHNHVIFQFIDKLSTKGFKHFAEKTDWGFEFEDKSISLEHCRWVKVVSVGEDVPEDIKPGMEVLVDKLKWTNAVKINGEDYWRTDSDHVLMVKDEKGTL